MAGRHMRFAERISLRITKSAACKRFWRRNTRDRHGNKEIAERRRESVSSGVDFHHCC